MKDTIKLVLILIIVGFLQFVEIQTFDVYQEPARKDIIDPPTNGTYPDYYSFYDGAYGNAGSLEGTTVIISIFANDPNYKWDYTSNKDLDIIDDALKRLGVATDYLTKAASMYSKKATFYYDWKKYTDLAYQTSFRDKIVRPDGGAYQVQSSWITNNIDLKTLKNKYKADNFVFLFFLNTDVSNEHNPWTLASSSCPTCKIEYSNIFIGFDGFISPTATYAHEILHQFGAPDLYYRNNVIPEEYVNYLRNTNSKDIMFTVNDGMNITVEFTPLDAYYVGIGPMPSTVSEWHLGYNERAY